MSSPQHPQIPWPHRQQSSQHRPILLITMRHHHHSIRSANPQSRQPRIPQNHHPSASGNRSARANCPRPSATVTSQPSRAAILTTGFASSPAPSTNNRCGPRISSTNRPSYSSPARSPAAQASFFSPKPSLANTTTPSRNTTRRKPFPSPGRYVTTTESRPASASSIASIRRPALRSIRRLQQQIHHPTTPQPKRNLSRIIERRRVALHHRALPHHPPRLANHLRLKTPPTDRPGINPICPQQQPSPRPPITRSLSPHQRHQHRGPTPPPKPNDLPPLHHPLSLIPHPTPMSSHPPIHHCCNGMPPALAAVIARHLTLSEAEGEESLYLLLPLLLPLFLPLFLPLLLPLLCRCAVAFLALAFPWFLLSSRRDLLL